MGRKRVVVTRRNSYSSGAATHKGKEPKAGEATDLEKVQNTKLNDVSHRPKGSGKGEPRDQGCCMTFKIARQQELGMEETKYFIERGRKRPPLNTT